MLKQGTDLDAIYESLVDVMVSQSTEFGEEDAIVVLL